MGIERLALWGIIVVGVVDIIIGSVVESTLLILSGVFIALFGIVFKVRSSKTIKENK